MEAVLGVLGSVLSGGATGLLGVLFQRFFDYKKQQQDIELVKVQNEHARMLAEMDVQKAQRAAEASERVAELATDAQMHTADMEAQARADEAAARSYIASVESDRATYLDPKSQERSKFARVMMTIVDAVRGLIRPVLTIYLVILTSVMFHWAMRLTGDGEALGGHAEMVKIVRSIVETILYLVTTCVVWWFGVRGSAKEKS
jgi:leucyl aminopeptidase (aminopeptidase T)